MVLLLTLDQEKVVVGKEYVLGGMLFLITQITLEILKQLQPVEPPSPSNYVCLLPTLPKISAFGDSVFTNGSIFCSLGYIRVEKKVMSHWST